MYSGCPDEETESYKRGICTDESDPDSGYENVYVWWGEPHTKRSIFKWLVDQFSCLIVALRIQDR